MALPGEGNQVICRYITDAGEVLTINMKRELAINVSNQVTDVRTVQGKPEMWKLRSITIQTISGNRLYKRRITICNHNNPLFLGTQQTLNVDGVVWRVTGRRGERRRGPYAS